MDEAEKVKARMLLSDEINDWHKLGRKWGYDEGFLKGSIFGVAITLVFLLVIFTFG